MGAASNEVRYRLLGSLFHFSAHAVYPNWDFVRCNALHCEQIVGGCVYVFNKLYRGNNSQMNLCSSCITVLSNWACCSLSVFILHFPSW